MNKKIVFISFLLSILIFFSGCTLFSSTQNKESDEKWNFDEIVENMQKEEREKLTEICKEEFIPAEYARDCYFFELDFCKVNSGEMIAKKDMDKCLPVFIREEFIGEDYYIDELIDEVISEVKKDDK